MNIIGSCHRVLSECRHKKVSVINCDGTGVGAGAAPYLNQEGVVSVSVKVGSSANLRLSELGEFNRLRDELWWRVRDWLASDKAMLPKDEQLFEELTVVTYKLDESERIRILKKD
jgi:hypothetical protein